MTTSHECDMRPKLLDAARGSIDPALERHLEECESCAAELRAERELDRTLERLPRPRAPESLRAKLRATSTRPSSSSPRPKTSMPRAVLPLLVAAAVLLVGYDIVTRYRAASAVEAVARLDDEAVNDHLRVVFRDQPDIASGGVHQVKPWFTGKLDFAPDVRFGGDDEFPLVGGSLAYFVDRRAAAFVFSRRLHLATLLVFRAEGLPLGDEGLTPLGSVRARERSVRGFHVISWRRDGLGYSLVSDVDARDLRLLAERLAPP